MDVDSGDIFYVTILSFVSGKNSRQFDAYHRLKCQKQTNTPRNQQHYKIWKKVLGEIYRGAVRVADARDNSVDAALAEISHSYIKKEEKRELKALSVDKMFPLSSLMAATGYLNS